MEIDEIYQIFLKSSGICTDTRKIKKNCIFFALKGERFNGNEYVSEALEKGADFAIADEKVAAVNEKVIIVEDSLKTLQLLANKHRIEMNARIIAITGSNGKTTTKELLHQLLKTTFNVIATKGNLNNHIGVPLTLLEIKPETQIAIIEMGANHIGEIRQLCDIAKPDEGIITNVGNAHLEGFGSFQGVKSGKAELYRSLEERNGICYLNADNEHLNKMLGNIEPVKYSFEKKAECNAEIFTKEKRIGLIWKFRNKGGKTLSQLTGRYNSENILAAICIAAYKGVNPSDIDEAVSKFVPSNQRSEIKYTDKNKLFLDLYNANPSSMKLAINEFISGSPDEMIILGDMKELGNYSEEKHIEILDMLRNKRIKDVYLAGEEFFKQKEKYDFNFYSNTEKLLADIEKIRPFGKHIFIKGSRSMQLEKLLTVL